MTSLVVEHYGVPTSRHEARESSYYEEWAVDDLSARTTWCAAAVGRRSARAMLEQLGRLEEQPLISRELTVTARGPLLELARRLQAMLRGERSATSRLVPDDRDIWAEAKAASEDLVGQGVQPDDLVVLHDPLALLLAEPLRERGAHAVWNPGLVVGPASEVRALARRFLGESTGPVDAYVMSWPRPRRGGRRIAAAIPSTDLIAAKDVDETSSVTRARNEGVALATALADVIRTDRAETVGGRLHVRPAVAAR